MALPDPRSLLPAPAQGVVPPRSQMLPPHPAPTRQTADEAERRTREVTGLAVRQVVYERRLTSVNPVNGEAFAWPRDGPLAVYMENTQDVEVTVEIHGALSNDTGRPLKTPIKSFTIGPGDRRLENVNSDSGDKWAPWVWPIMTAAAAASSGSLRIEFARPGV